MELTPAVPLAMSDRSAQLDGTLPLRLLLRCPTAHTVFTAVTGVILASGGPQSAS